MRRTAVLLVSALVSALISVLPAAGPPAVASLDSGDAEPRFNALVFSKTNGFRHESIPDGVAAIQELGAEHGFSVTVTEDAELFTDAELAKYDVVVFNNTNSRNGPILDAAQRAAFERYIGSGGG